MASLAQSGNFGTINTDDTTTNGFYFIKFISEAYMLKNNTTIYGQIITAGKLFVKAQYLYSTKENPNWYYDKQPLQQTIMVPT